MSNLNHDYPEYIDYKFKPKKEKKMISDISLITRTICAWSIGLTIMLIVSIISYPKLGTWNFKRLSWYICIALAEIRDIFLKHVNGFNPYQMEGKK
jgi:hypothetical protein